MNEGNQYVLLWAFSTFFFPTWCTYLCNPWGSVCTRHHLGTIIHPLGRYSTMSDIWLAALLNKIISSAVGSQEAARNPLYSREASGSVY